MTAKEDFPWSDESKKIRGIDITPAKKEVRKEDYIHIKIDRSTLPKDGQRVVFQHENEDWSEGYFVGGDDLFWVSESKWYRSWDVIKWKYV